MLTAIAKIHWPKLWVTEGGLELPLVNLAVVITVGLMGPGEVTLDHGFGTALPPNASFVGVGLVIAGWVVALIVSTVAAVDRSTLNN
jgi:putative oxidoreductase